MILKLERTGLILSDRMVIGKESDKISDLYADHSLFGWLQRIISWICSPCWYTSENRRTIECVKNYLIDQIGAQRLRRVCDRYGMDLVAMELKGSPLLSRDIAKLMTSIKDVKVEDIDELIEIAK